MLFSSDVASPIGRLILLGRLEERSMRTGNERRPTSSVPSMSSASEPCPDFLLYSSPPLRSLCV
ncbi:hypothetical protein N7455_012397 [Penicillium solitum]|uniref:uncharacterized protein n=1 Tax=Penicillium solitum TaxID=60172 RepID=UPI0032C4069C|nr:hypothetical protein N7536_003542 [Penicillium majusculum]KAJ5848440.1 hypothetical protein N7455_012397 [Penicillium solitum]